MKAPSKRQRDVLAAVVEHMRRETWPPTARELCAMLGIRSTSGVEEHLRALERKGLIERASRRQALRVTEDGKSAA